MTRIPLLALLVLATFACSSTEPRKTGDVPANETFPAYDTWVGIMENVIGPSFDDVLIVEASKDPENMDLPKIARVADRAARYMALGHGMHRDASVAEFGEFAKACEAWLRDIEQKARAGAAGPVQSLIVKGEERHCARCHEATRP